MKITYRERVERLLLKCNYITYSPTELPPQKGIRKFISRLWRGYNDILCFISEKHENAVLEIMREIADRMKNE